MPSQWFWIIFNLALCAVALEHDSIKAFLEITEFEYEDNCNITADAEWTFINSPSSETLSLWEEKLISYATFKNTQKNEVANVSNTSDPSLKHKYDVADKAGDALLETEDSETLIHFAGTAELLRLSTLRTGVLKNYTRKDVERVLSHNNNVNNKRSTWTAWHQELAPLIKNFTTVLPLADKAAKANDAKDVAEYWELLSGFSDGYEKINYEWSKVANLHKKVVQFVKNSLSHKYNVTMDDTIPAYLLGSLQGSDWTPISVDAVPYPERMYNIKKNLWKRKLLGKSLYTTASVMSTQMVDQVPQADFWDNSYFNKQCPSKLINFCKDGITRVSTCFEPTVSNFLSAHKNIGTIVLNQMSAEMMPVLNTANRYSALEVGVSELFGILAASPAWLNYTRIVDNSTDNEQLSIVSLMITALDTLPRLAYYMSADRWRINAINNGITNSEDLVSSWWKCRQEYEGLNSNGTEPPTFLNDDYITNNRPYLSKLTGTILAFQFYEYLTESTEVRYDSILGRQTKAEFIKMIQEGGADDWTRVINKYLEINEISSDALLSFFSPLEDFIDYLEEDYEYKTFTVKESELEALEKNVIKEFNAPSTTTTSTTTTTTTAPSRNISKKRKISNTISSSKESDEKSNAHATVNSDKNSDPKNVQDEKSGNRKVSEASLTIPFDESIDDLAADQDKKPKINTTKAVWAVGAVLLATIAICIIAIFGKQRCRKTPKNRRYV
ncbi:angiotensin-converting enzyme-like [Hylaeus volcanicus]|uniref:angiotensin-converting enzyme-like n=1 Tax=Hylaeus volcanicus TaxID=313075 RepID=UPI0023B7B935|nr:angiotensin-converting enzyme-like [Hylaeus volcanicus]